MSGLEGPAERKAALRREMRQARDALPPGYRASASSTVRQRVARLAEFSSASGFVVCVPFRNEVDLSDLYLDPPPGKTAYLPRVDSDGGRLDLCRYPCLLAAGPWGLTEPAPHVSALGSERVACAVQLALVPGLAFSRVTMHRVGYGGGYFDRFLAESGVFAIGVCFERQLQPSVPHGPGDRPVDVIVTEVSLVRSGTLTDGLATLREAWDTRDDEAGYVRLSDRALYSDSDLSSFLIQLMGPAIDGERVAEWPRGRVESFLAFLWRTSDPDAMRP